MEFYKFISIFMFCLLPLFIGGTIGLCSRWKEESKQRELDFKKEFYKLDGYIDCLKNDLEDQKKYFNAKLFLAKFKWTDIKNVKLRKQTQELIKNYNKSNTFRLSESLITDKVQIIQNALIKDALIGNYTENKIKK